MRYYILYNNSQLSKFSVTKVMLVTTAKRKPLDTDKRRKRNLYSVQQIEYTVLIQQTPQSITNNLSSRSSYTVYDSVRSDPPWQTLTPDNTGIFPLE